MNDECQRFICVCLFCLLERKKMRRVKRVMFFFFLPQINGTAELLTGEPRDLR